MRQFRRRSLRMRTAAQKRCPASFERRMLAAYAEHPATMNGRAMIGHARNSRFARGGTFSWVPDITLSLYAVKKERDSGSNRQSASAHKLPTANPAPPQVLLAHHLRQLKLPTP